MNLQVVSFETAKRLYETGFKGESIFYWKKTKKGKKKLFCVYSKKLKVPLADETPAYPAYHIEELLRVVAGSFRLSSTLELGSLAKIFSVLESVKHSKTAEENPADYLGRQLAIALYKKILIKK